MFMNCNIVMTTTMDNPYCAIHRHIYIRHSSHLPCISNGEDCESQPGRGASPPRGLRPLGRGGSASSAGRASRAILVIRTSRAHDATRGTTRTGHGRFPPVPFAMNLP
jgi:hypothetical protein